jgi:transmembrane sensor
VALWAGFLLSRPAALDYVSQAGQVRRLALADGTVIHLNSASAIEVRFSDKARMVLLKAGEALFEVAQDTGRPFIVMAGKTSLRALDTVFPCGARWARRCG